MRTDNYNVIDAITSYETGDATEHETMVLFTYLVETGLINQLQGSYQRTAMRLMQTGQIPVDDDEDEYIPEDEDHREHL